MPRWQEHCEDGNPAPPSAGAPPGAWSLADFERHDGGAGGGHPGGTERRFLCPFPACADHQRPGKDRSLSFNAATGAWHCFRCGEKGIDPAYRRDGGGGAAAPPPRSRKERARRGLGRITALPADVPGAPPLPAPAPDPSQGSSAPAASAALSAEQRRAIKRANLQPLDSPGGRPGARYLEGRGLDPGFCQGAGARFSASFYGRPAVCFAVRDGDGELVAVQGRYVDGRDDPRMRTCGPRRLGVFRTPGALEALAAGGPLVLTEAPIDAISLASAGLPAAALCGKEGVPAWLVERSAFRPVLLAFDADEAGDAAAKKLLPALRKVGASPYRLVPEGAKDWNDLLRREGADALRAQLAGALALLPPAPPGPTPPEPSEEDRRVQAAYLAAEYGAMPAADLALPSGVRITDPGEFFLGCARALRRLRAAFGGGEGYLDAPDAAALAADLEFVADWWGAQQGGS